MVSSLIECKILRNARDLGGMINKDGRKIKCHKLLRSASFSEMYCDRNDVLKLRDEYKMNRVVDLRNVEELVDMPDMIVENVRYYQYPVMGYRSLGIEHDSTSKEEREKYELTHSDPTAAKDDMTDSYRQFAINPVSLEAYSKFINLLLRENDGACLWHCAMGKDRAGIASAIVELLLDIDMETVIEDYLLTNKAFYGDRQPENSCEDWFCFAHKEYLQAFFDAIEEYYGSFQEYFKTGLNLTDEQIAKFKEMYLE